MKHLTAVIREAECIGCTKCIQVCPVDAIMGAAKQMHTVLRDECTGCEFCIAPCPVDCIDYIEIETPSRPELYHARHDARLKRLSDQESQQNKSNQPKAQSVNTLDRKTYIQQALERVKDKKQSRGGDAENQGSRRAQLKASTAG
ncbi:MAG: RnfABCDGE type electron transport complex subunit B [Gammaproteobacteria bacterium]|nr:RnfABCDGE type electron transport complex subunit B [Gammaproteobacteria bacterium]